jgi:hypothetical protein
MSDKNPKGAAWKSDRKQSSNEKCEIEYRIIRRIRRELCRMMNNSAKNTSQLSQADTIGYRQAITELRAYLKKQ